MTFEEKIAILDGFEKLLELNYSHFDIIAEWVFDKNAYVRSRCAELLINFETQESKKLLFMLAGDEDELVRIEAYDSLSVIHVDDVEIFLATAMINESDELARSYSIISWAGVALALHYDPLEQISKIEKLKTQEESQKCVLSYCYAQYIFGKKEILDELLSYLNDNNYHVRCTTISYLADIIDETNIGLIKNAIVKLLATEETRAVRDQAERFLKKH